MTFETFCAVSAITYSVKLAFATWLGAAEIGQLHTEAMWRAKWERFRRVTGETPRRAKAV